MSIEPIGTALLLLLNLAIGVLLVAAIVTKVREQKRQRRDVQKKFNIQGDDDTKIFLVSYSSEAGFNRTSKITAIESVGALTITPSAIVFRGEVEGGVKLELEFPIGAARLLWVGRRLINGLYSWFAIDQQGEKHYFTSAASFTVFGSKRRTRRIYNDLAPYFLNN